VQGQLHGGRFCEITVLSIVSEMAICMIDDLRGQLRVMVGCII